MGQTLKKKSKYERRMCVCIEFTKFPNFILETENVNDFLFASHDLWLSESITRIYFSGFILFFNIKESDIYKNMNYIFLRNISLFLKKQRMTLSGDKFKRYFYCEEIANYFNTLWSTIITLITKLCACSRNINRLQFNSLNFTVLKSRSAFKNKLEQNRRNI